MTLVGIAILILGLFILSKILLTPLYELNRAMLLIARHSDLNQRLDDSGKDEFSEIAASFNDKGSLGLANTLVAVQEQRVQTLVISEGFGAPGSVCAHCGYLTLRPSDKCPICGGEARTVPDIVEHLVRRAIGMDMEVVFVEDAELDKAGSIGAIWRF